MSWEAHSTHMLNTFGAGNCEYVGLFGKGDGVAWAESGSGSLKGKFQAAHVANNATAPTQSLMVGGQKYFFLKPVEDGIYAYNCKGKAVVVGQGKKCIIIACPNEGLKAENVTDAVKKSVEYMSSLGY